MPLKALPGTELGVLPADALVAVEARGVPTISAVTISITIITIISITIISITIIIHVIMISSITISISIIISISISISLNSSSTGRTALGSPWPRGGRRPSGRWPPTTE